MNNMIPEEIKGTLFFLAKKDKGCLNIFHPAFKCDVDVTIAQLAIMKLLLNKDVNPHHIIEGAISMWAYTALHPISVDYELFQDCDADVFNTKASMIVIIGGEGVYVFDNMKSNFLRSSILALIVMRLMSKEKLRSFVDGVQLPAWLLLDIIEDNDKHDRLFYHQNN